MPYPQVYCPGAEPRGWKKTATQVCTTIRDQAVLGERLPPEAEGWIFALFYTRHTHRDTIASWQQGVYVREDENGWRRYEFDDASGAAHPVSWRNAVSPPSDQAVKLAAMREAVRWQVKEFKDLTFTPGFSCPGCGTRVLFRREAHADHGAPAFADLASGFAVAQGGWAGVQVNHLSDDRDTLAEPVLSDWEAYHAEHARLTLVCALCNLKRGRNG